MTDEQRMRHTAKPGLSGLAQVMGRNAIISNGWYFQVALILYIVFYISFKITQNDDKALFICTAMVLVFCVLNFGFKQSQTLYESVLAFPMGMLFVFNDNLSKKMTSVRAVMPAAMFFIITVVGEYLMRGSPMGIICKMISALTFVICVLCFHSFVSRTKVKKLMTDPMLKWLGNRSFEIYAIQGLFTNTFKAIPHRKNLSRNAGNVI